MARRRKSNPLGLPARVYFKHGRFRFLDSGNRWHALGKEWDVAAKRQWAMVSSITPVAGTIGELLNDYIENFAKHRRSPRTYQDHHEEKKHLIPVFGSMKASDLRPTHVAQYLMKRGRTANTRANREAALLSSAYSYGMRIGFAGVEFNPCHGVRRNEEHARERCPERWEIEFVKGLATETIAAVADLVQLIADRGKDIFKIMLDDLTVEGIRVRQTKRGSKRLVEWSDELRASVERIKALKRPVKSLYLITNEQGQPYTRKGFSSMWSKLVRKAVALEMISEPFTFHDIRARAITDKEEAEGLRAARDFAGHKTTRQTEDYVRNRKFIRTKPTR